MLWHFSKSGRGYLNSPLVATVFHLMFSTSCSRWEYIAWNALVSTNSETTSPMRVEGGDIWEPLPTAIAWLKLHYLYSSLSQRSFCKVDRTIQSVDLNWRFELTNCWWLVMSVEKFNNQIQRRLMRQILALLRQYKDTVAQPLYL